MPDVSDPTASNRPLGALSPAGQPGTQPLRRIGILLTNDDRSAFAQAYPNDGEKFAANLKALRSQWQYTVLPVTQGVFPDSVEAYDGYLITGSPASVNAGHAWVAQLLDFIRALHAARRPTAGLCFGHQAIAKALGGVVGDNPQGWGLGVACTGVQQFEAWMQPAQPQLHLFAAHNEQVLQPPPQARVLGGSAFCPVGTMAVGQHLFSSQYHPEMSRAFMADLLVYLDGKLPAPVISQARAQLQEPLDADLMFGWIVQFFELPRLAGTHEFAPVLKATP